jgi:hypothetical protein
LVLVVLLVYTQVTLMASVTANGAHPIVLGPALPTGTAYTGRFLCTCYILPMEVLLSLMVVFLLYLPKKHGEVVWYCLVV